MKSWIHELSESYVAGHKPVRKDLKENYVSLTEEQRFGLLSENVLAYLDEQLQNAYGFDIDDLNEEELNSILSTILEFKGPIQRSLIMATQTPPDPSSPHDTGIIPNQQAADLRTKRLNRVKKIVDDPNVKLRDTSLKRFNKTFNRLQAARYGDEQLHKRANEPE